MLDNYLQWVIFNTKNDVNLGKPDSLPIPIYCLQRVCYRSYYWAKHYPGDKVFLIFDIFDDSLLSKEQIANINFTMSKIAEFCPAKNVVVVNFADLCRGKIMQDSKLNTSELNNIKLAQGVPELQLCHMDSQKESSSSKSIFEKEVMDFLRHDKQLLTDAINYVVNDEMIDCDEKDIMLTVPRALIVDGQRYAVIDKFPVIRDFLKIEERTKPVLYTDIDISINMKIDPAAKGFDATLMSSYSTNPLSLSDNDAILAHFNESGVNSVMEEVIKQCINRGPLDIKNIDHYNSYSGFLLTNDQVKAMKSGSTSRGSSCNTLYESKQPHMKKYVEVNDLLHYYQHLRPNDLAEHEVNKLQQLLPLYGMHINVNHIEDITAIAESIIFIIRRHDHLIPSKNDDLEFISSIKQKYIQSYLFSDVSVAEHKVATSDKPTSVLTQPITEDLHSCKLLDSR